MPFIKLSAKSHPIILYKTKSSKPSGVTAYEIGSDYILVQVNVEATYKYSYASAGKQAIQQMKKLAKASKGLSTFISRHKPEYEEKSS